jgi:short-subunit dehydrogenase
MIKQKTVSKIVATSSLSGLINSAPATGVPYVVSKHSVTLIMESLQHELRKSEATRHVSSHLLLPGIIRTGITENSRRSVRSHGVTESQTIGLTDEQLQRMDSKDLAKYEKGTFSGQQLVEGFWSAMHAGKFYCMVTPPGEFVRMQA